MNRQHLEKLSLDELREELLCYGLPPMKTKTRCVETILAHLEEHTSRDPESTGTIGITGGLPRTPTSTQTTRQQESNPVDAENIYSSSANPTLNQIMLFFAEKMRQQEEMMAQLINFSVNNAAAAQNVNADIGSSSTSGAVNRQQSLPMSSMSPAHAVSLLTSQIPSFSGTENEDIELWVQKVDYIALVHGVDDKVTVLAASNKLNKYARDWFDMSSGSFLHSWQLFKEGIVKRFKQYIPFHVTLQKVEARRWNFPKESFQKYAAQKLKLLHRLKLPEPEQIQLIIKGIGSLSIRSTAALIKTESIDDFLNEMYRVINTCGVQSGKSPVPDKKFKSKDFPDSSTESGSSFKPSKDVSCAYCKARGHVKNDCFKLKKKEQATQKTVSKQSDSSNTVEDSRPASFPVGHVDSKILECSDSIIEVNSLNDLSCKLFALIDTGSPVSFIRYSVYKPFFGENYECEKSTTNIYKAINGFDIPVICSCNTKIELSVLPNVKYKVKFQIIDEDSWSGHLLLGRDFFIDNNLSLLYKPANNNSSDRLKLFNEIASVEITEENVSNADKQSVLNIKTDFDSHINTKVIELIDEVEKLPSLV